MGKSKLRIYVKLMTIVNFIIKLLLLFVYYIGYCGPHKMTDTRKKNNASGNGFSEP